MADASSAPPNDCSNELTPQVPCKQQAAVSDDLSDAIVPSSTQSAREHSIFSINDVVSYTGY